VTNKLYRKSYINKLGTWDRQKDLVFNLIKMGCAAKTLSDTVLTTTSNIVLNSVATSKVFKALGIK
jgi:hypothetical protein